MNQDKTNFIIAMIIVILVTLILITSIAFASNNYHKSKKEIANNLGCIYEGLLIIGGVPSCYKENADGELIKYQMRKLNDEWKLVRE